MWLANNFPKVYDVTIPYASPTVLASLENREPSVDWSFPHKFSFYFIMVASTGNLQFNSRLVTKITNFVSFYLDTVTLSQTIFFFLRTACVKIQFRTD